MYFQLIARYKHKPKDFKYKFKNLNNYTITGCLYNMLPHVPQTKIKQFKYIYLSPKVNTEKNAGCLSLDQNVVRSF